MIAYILQIEKIYLGIQEFHYSSINFPIPPANTKKIKALGMAAPFKDQCSLFKKQINNDHHSRYKSTKIIKSHCVKSIIWARIFNNANNEAGFINSYGINIDYDSEKQNLQDRKIQKQYEIIDAVKDEIQSRFFYGSKPHLIFGSKANRILKIIKNVIS